MRIFQRFMIFCFVFIAGGRSNAAVIFQGGSAGQTGVSWEDVNNQLVPSTNVDPDVFIGARFYVAVPAVTTRMGGHFVGHPFNDTPEFFGAIVRLSGPTDLPDSDDLSSSDVIAHALLSFTNPSSVVYGDLDVQLSPGWYGVVFGSGLFGTHSYGAALRNGVDIGSQSYFGWQPTAFGWYDASALYSGFFDNHYFVVEGSFIPEPSSLALALFAAIGPFAIGVRYAKQNIAKLRCYRLHQSGRVVPERIISAFDNCAWPKIGSCIWPLSVLGSTLQIVL